MIHSSVYKERSAWDVFICLTCMYNSGLADTIWLRSLAIVCIQVLQVLGIDLTGSKMCQLIKIF